MSDQPAKTLDVVPGTAIELPVSTRRAREILGVGGHPMGSSRMSAIKTMMGIKGSHYVFVSQIVAFLKENNGFSEHQVYRRKKSNSQKKRT